MNKKNHPKNETKNVDNTCVKCSYSSTHVNMAEGTQKVSQILVGCNQNQMSQKPYQMTIKIVNFITYLYVMPF
jgi:hypothetical protein